MKAITIDQMVPKIGRPVSISVRITGCPNGCARPYTGDIGIVGRMPGYSSLYIGGDFEGTRLNEAIAERLDIAMVSVALREIRNLSETGSGSMSTRPAAP